MTYIFPLIFAEHGPLRGVNVPVVEGVLQELSAGSKTSGKKLGAEKKTLRETSILFSFPPDTFCYAVLCSGIKVKLLLNNPNIEK
jgi:hypothetical protein